MIYNKTQVIAADPTQNCKNIPQEIAQTQSEPQILIIIQSIHCIKGKLEHVASSSGLFDKLAFSE